ncbi:YchJ family protein [Enterobacillus tribolii]|uniref:UPF0225 protein C8D90_101742 n=1 Tax=Enterobacillus tribolii TaxID=1487935 RepID=A0A370R4H3_9GAMM|nr:SEC-C motif-containing protein [Enterobacillus tribolii]
MLSPSPAPTLCPCQSGKAYTECCQPVIQGQRAAQTPEQLMRSRYTAFVTHNADYLIASWHPDCQMEAQRDSIIASFADTEWRGLSIVSTHPGKNADEGYVEFMARYHSSGKDAALHERSRFLRLEERWYYVDGSRPQVGRNDPCPCGSGKKYKKCCGQ